MPRRRNNGTDRDDFGHALTEKQLAALEKRIKRVYRQAYKDLSNTAQEYFDKFIERDTAQKAKLDAGEITEDYYKQWRLAQIGRGKRFEAMRDQMAERMTEANEVAVSYVNDATPSIYSLNRNYAAYTIEQVAGDVGFTLWDEQTVKRLIVEEPDSMPYYPPEKAVKRGVDLVYGKKQITASVTSGILRGNSIKKISDDLQSRIVTMNRDSAIRSARTAVTGAQNAGRMDSYKAAQKMGIKLKKEWLATLDGRTRHSHALLDGEKVDNDKKFSNGLRFPGDPYGAPAEVYNCRCTLIASVDGVDTSDAARWARDPKTGGTAIIEDMSYREWARMVAKRQNAVDAASISRYNKIIQKHVSVDSAKAFQEAKDGGRHKGVYADAIRNRKNRLEKSIASHTAQVEEHASKIANPAAYDAGWADKTPHQRDGLLKKWEKDMRRNAEQAEIEISVWKERFENEQ